MMMNIRNKQYSPVTVYLKSIQLTHRASSANGVTQDNRSKELKTCSEQFGEKNVMKLSLEKLLG